MRRLLLGVVACAALIGCGSDDDPVPPTTPLTFPTATTVTTTIPTTTTDVPPGYLKATVDPSLPRQDIDVDVRYPAHFTPQQLEVVQTWANSRHASYVVIDPPDPDSPLIDRYATPQVASVNRAGVQRRLDEGTITRLPLNSVLHETVTQLRIEGSLAALTTCQVDDAVVMRAADGTIVDDDVGTRTFRAFLTLGPDGWRVSPPRPDHHESWPGAQEGKCLP